jgi:NAD+ synthase (glutamine-hydrolysing)
MRIGLAQINTIVGDLAGNSRRILEAYQALVAQGAELVIYPELVVSGYPPRDLLFKKHFVADVEKTTRELATKIGSVPALIGYTEANTTGTGRSAFNSAAFCHQGKILTSARKCLLPTYDVFDEDRYFEPASAPIVIEFGGRRIGVTICEDIWTHAMISTRRLYNGAEPVRQLAAQRCDVMVNLSASPWNHGKGDIRHKLVADTARQLGCPVAYVNAIGGNDELLFDGRSVVTDAEGQTLAGLAAFREELSVVDLSRSKIENQKSKIHATFEQADLADIYDALVLGVRDYAHKSGFKKALLGLSGGIDSAVLPPSSPPRPSARKTSSASACRPSSPASTRKTTPASWPKTSVSSSTPSPSPTPSAPPRRRSPRSSPAGRATSPRRTSRPAPAACC